MKTIEQQVLEIINPAEFRELAEWARAVPRSLLSDGSPNAKHYKRIACLLDDLAKLNELTQQLAMTKDDELGMAWWNRLSEQERARWSRAAGNTGRAKDAWEEFKRISGDQQIGEENARET